MNCPHCGKPMEEGRSIAIDITLSGTEGADDEAEERTDDDRVHYSCVCGYKESREV